MSRSRMWRTAPVIAAGVCVLVTAGCTSSKHSTSAGPLGPSASGSAPTAPSTSNPTVPGQSKSATSKTTVPASAPYPTPDPNVISVANQAPVLHSLPGSTASSCAVVGTHTSIRSGSIGAGDFVSARKMYTATVNKTEVPDLNLYVIPEHATGLKTVTITVDPLGAGATTKVVGKSIEQADVYSYFPVQVPIRAPGTYRLTMVAGPNKGCFVVTFTK